MGIRHPAASDLRPERATMTTSTPEQSGSRLNLSALLNDLAQILVATHDDEPGSTPANIVQRLREVIIILFNEFLSPSVARDPKPRELSSLLKLTNLALERYPQVFSEPSEASPLKILARILPLLSDRRLLGSQESLFETARALLYQLPTAPAPSLILRGCCDLLSDIFTAMEINVSHPGSHVVITAFQDLCQACRGPSQASQSEPSCIDFDASDTQQLHILAASICRLLAIVATNNPSTSERPPHTALAEALLPFVTASPPAVQACAMDALAAVARSFPEQAPVHEGLAGLQLAIRAASQAAEHLRPGSAGALLDPSWARSVRRCALHLAHAKMFQTGSLVGVGALADALVQACCSVPAPCESLLVMCDTLQSLQCLDPSVADSFAGLIALIEQQDPELRCSVVSLLTTCTDRLCGAGELPDQAVAQAFGPPNSTAPGALYICPVSSRHLPCQTHTVVQIWLVTP